MAFERLLDDATLDAFAAAVNQANLAEPSLVRRVHVLFDDRLDIAWLEGVQIERPFNRDLVGHFGVWDLGFGI
jgi:hypothetical protein